MAGVMSRRKIGEIKAYLKADLPGFLRKIADSVAAAKL